MTFLEMFNSQFSLIQYGELAIRLIAAAACGVVIGMERSKRLKVAGVRTHVIVCCASALMMIVSKYGFADLIGSGAYALGTRGADPARVAAQVVSGVSFLGAGIIFHSNNTIKGLTTAAGVWATAGIGMAIGSGFYWLGFFVTLLLAGMQIFTHKFTIGADALTTTKIEFTAVNTPEFRDAINEYLKDLNAQISESKVEINEEGLIKYSLTVRANKQITIEELNFFLESKGKVRSLSCIVVN